MAVRLRFINLIVRRDKIEEKYPGGWEKCLEDHEGSIEGFVYHDDHLFVDTAMSPYDMGHTLDHWLSLGFEGAVEKDGEKVWGDDMCIAEALYGGATLPCRWLEMKIDPTVIYAYLHGTPPGEIVGLEEAEESDTD